MMPIRVRQIALRTALGVGAVFAIVATSLQQAGAAYFVVSGDATNFAVLDEGNNGSKVNFSNSTITGNVGIAGTGKFQPSCGCAKPPAIRA